MSKANDSETGRLRRKSEAMEEKESQSLRQKLVSRCSYLVNRKKRNKEKRMWDSKPTRTLRHTPRLSLRAQAKQSRFASR